MSIKLIAMDMDGTLLNSRKKISERNLRALKAAADAGIWIVPCTGRSVTGLAEALQDLPFVRYVITVNGAALVDLEDNRRLLFHAAMSAEKSAEIWRFIKKYDPMQDVSINGRNYIDTREMKKLYDFGWNETRIKVMKSIRTPKEGLDEEILAGKHEIEKMILYFKKRETRLKAWEELKQNPYVSVTSALVDNLEINRYDATKGEGLRRLAEHLGLSLSETMACGDSFNDESMIRAAGIGVAMANADEEIKEIADVITLSNDDDGIAYAIEKWVLV